MTWCLYAFLAIHCEFIPVAIGSHISVCKHYFGCPVLRNFYRAICAAFLPSRGSACNYEKKFPQHKAKKNARSYAREDCHKCGTSCRLIGRLEGLGWLRTMGPWEGEGDTGIGWGSQQTSPSVTQTSLCSFCILTAKLIAPGECTGISCISTSSRL